jgi:hypothetical protein
MTADLNASAVPMAESTSIASIGASTSPVASANTVSPSNLVWEGLVALAMPL